MMQEQKAFDGFDVSVDNKAKLEAKFIVPPFSVLDTRQGYWQERKRLWLSLGIQSELGRGESGKTMFSKQATCPVGGGVVPTDSYWASEANKDVETTPKRKINGLTFRSTGFMAEVLAERGGGTSIFAPVLCELIYKWFCPAEGHILDPFAGGSVRGIVASVLGNGYTGIDLSGVQLEANKEQAKVITPDSHPEWIVGDSHELDSLLPANKYYDLIFSCPPYHDLEQYTDDPSDLSNMSWNTFKEKYREIIAQCILKLNNNRFACFVVSEIRDGIGAYKGLVPYTIACFTQSGARYYNEMILVNVAGSLPVRIAGQFGHRKIGRTHQNILVFYKGDIEAIPKYFKEIDTSFNYGNEQ